MAKQGPNEPKPLTDTEARILTVVVAALVVLGMMAWYGIGLKELSVMIEIAIPVLLACGGWAMAYCRTHSMTEMAIGIVLGALGTIWTLQVLWTGFMTKLTMS